MKRPKNINWDKFEEDPYEYSKKLSIDELEELLRYLSYKYYNTDKSIVSDEIYDVLKNLLGKKDPKNKFLKEVGAPVKNEKKKVKLPYPMNSLNKIRPETDAVEKWTKKYKGKYLISDKLDGGSAQLHKKDGKLFFYSRGKNNVGQDITELLYNVVKKEILNKLPETITIRGELIISKKNFEKIKDEYKNARNAVAGIINAKDLNKRRKVVKLVEFVPYIIMYPTMSVIEQVKELKKWGFKLPYYEILDTINNNILSKILKKRKKKSEYEIDGLVVTDNGKHKIPIDENPKYSFAFKSILTETMAESTVLKVIWQISKDKFMKPVIRIEPFFTEGVEINYCTVHNAKFVVDNILGPGAIVLMTRSGGVIPKVVEVIKPASNGKPQMPKTKYSWNETGVDIISEEKSHHTQVNIKRLVFFFKELEIKNVGEGVVTKLVNNGFTSVKKILKAKPEDFYDIEGLGEKSANKICDNIKEMLETTSLDKLMSASQAFGRNFGKERFSVILKKYPNILELSDKISEEELLELILSIKGFADIMAKLFVTGLPVFKKFAEQIKKYVNIEALVKKAEKAKSKNKKSKINGKKIAITGTRDAQLIKKIKELGGEISSTVTKNTDILIVAGKSIDQASTKTEKAEKLGIKIMTVDEFKKFIEDGTI